MKHIFLFFLLISLGCQKENFTLSGIIEDHLFLRNGNLHMPVTVAGNINSNKMVVLIHGGPGGNGLEYRDNFIIDILEKEVAVVYWDQRFAGNSQGNGGSSDVTDFREDIKKLIHLLRVKYSSSVDIYLLAHSWGGFLAPYFLVESDYQALIKGWIQVGGAHNYRLNDSLTREMLLNYGVSEIAAGNNTEDWNEIVEWCENNGFEGYENTIKLNDFAHRAELLIEDVYEPEFFLEWRQLLKNALLSQWSNQIATGIRQIDNPTYSIPITDELFKIQLPTLLLWGKYDFVCPPELAKDIEINIGSRDVTKIIYLNSGHSPMANQPELFWSDVLNWIEIQ
jgi:pimeloyl-ACP methyl ester carboxylesterase